MEKYEARILRRLMPLAIKKLAKSLRADDGDLEAAKIVLARFDKMLDHKHERELTEAANGGGEDTLADWYAQWAATPGSSAPIETAAKHAMSPAKMKKNSSFVSVVAVVIARNSKR